ncbi:MAG: glutamine synthetase [Bacteroidetes Order II. Incertae sedis bacterium]|jgi:glutamine synthetase|nr:glutamine synthetase [Bacteroidetes Order II. bacterium]MBT4052695.1 glutamine synthetase [Bacteroidetes Order II. bacterium]MBT4601493.1 glutamine synthetase [Bacteroidetes Order II. bacterium]MBT5249996.1 glutamine synthetase [Bacteroidetes Order II. bacterium]MBT6200590.1 glutamine synthetase [Bacteroidetes Order II. bacterium]
MNGMLTLDDLKREVKEERIDTVLVCFPDMFGRLVGKRFHARFFLESAHGETHACDYLLADDIDMEPVPGYKAANWARGYGDFVMKPDLRTLRRIPWLEATALVLCDVEDHHHKPVDHSPRAMLQKQLARLEAHGLKAMMASELEFYLFDESYRDISDRNFQEPRTSGTYIQDYHILQTTREEPVLRAMRNGLEGAGIPVENSKGEWGPGQEELNIEYSDALSMADRHVIMKNGMKEIADAHGKAITFMAKWKTDLAGSSCHIHLSLQDGQGSNVFCESKDEHGMSDTMRHFMAGQLAHASDITYFLAPFINSYKRFQAGTFAPTKAIWSRDNRTAGFRLCGEGGKAIRSECRIGGADLNPYLAFAALIAAGLDGIENKRALEEAYMGDAYTGDDLREIPKTLREAIVALDGSTMLREALGDHVIEHYVHTARWEQSEFDRQVTDWEVKRGFERS